VQAEAVWVNLPRGHEFVFVIREPFRLARLVLRCFRENPGGQFVLPAEDGKTSLVPAEPLHEQHTHNGEKWWADDGWSFREGEAAFRGVSFEIQGVLWRLLKTLADRPKPVSKHALIDAMNNVGMTQQSTAGEDSLRSHLTRLRIALRTEFRIPKGRDPIRNCERGSGGAWKLDEKVFPSVAEIQRPLNGR